MCSLEHDTCANMFSSGLHKRQEKNTKLKINFQSRGTHGNLPCIILCNFPSNSSLPPASHSLKGVGNSKEQHRFLHCDPGQALLKPLQKLSSDFFLRGTLPSTCSFRTQFSINTLQLPLWLSQALFTPSRLLRRQCQADI